MLRTHFGNIDIEKKLYLKQAIWCGSVVNTNHNCWHTNIETGSNKTSFSRR